MITSDDIKLFDKIIFINCFEDSDKNSVSDKETKDESRAEATVSDNSKPDDNVGLSNSFHKYMPLTRVLDLLKNNRFVFVNPRLWKDPFEILYLNTDFTSFGYEQPKNIYGFCFRNNRHNSEPSWKVYASPGEPLIRCNINAQMFLKVLNQFAKDNKCSVYISKVQYKDATSIKKIAMKRTNEYKEWFGNGNPVNDALYIKLLSLKRRAFEYEDEYRAFIVPDSENSFDSSMFIDQNSQILKFPIDLSIISRYVYEPLGRLSDNQNDDEVRQMLYEADYSAARMLIKMYRPNASVDNAVLYRNYDQIEKIEK